MRVIDKNEDTEHEEALDKIEKRAYELARTIHGCAQCPLLALQEAFNLKDDMLFKAAGIWFRYCQIGFSLWSIACWMYVPWNKVRS
jgi:hypothetical protein